jgi:anti-sigma regulatory factor (Ser/Thr protein kinase)
MKTRDLAAITQWITAAATDAGADLPSAVMKRLSIGRRASLTLLRKLVAAQWLVHEGSTRKGLWKPGALRQVVQRYPLDGLQEDLPWARDFAPYFALPPEVARIAQHAFTELLNNAIDHSGGTQVTVSMRQTALHLQLLVSDDGCGVFHRIETAFDIADPTLAMLELSKGKLTSQPDRHTGRGLFFTSRLADMFDLHANATAFQFRGLGRRAWFKGKPIARQGTSIYMAIALETTRTLDSVLKAHSLDGAGYGFERTVVPLQLLLGAATGLESRAQAKRVATRLHSFRRAEVDFTGIADIGHGFADELFRVQINAHPGLEIVPVGMAPRVAALVDSVRPVPA